MLNQQVLVLNRNYVAISLTTIKRALSKLFSDKAEIITIESGSYCSYDISSWIEASELKKVHGDEFIESPSFTIIIPRVIRMLTYDGMPKQKVRLNRRNLYARDRNTCQYCGAKHTTSDLNIDHVIPKSRGGKSTWTNLVVSCIYCNSKKANKTLEEAKMKLIKKPYEPKSDFVFKITIMDERYNVWKNFLSESYWTTKLRD